MKYIDSMLFIYAAINTDETGKKARKHIKEIRTGKEKTVTSALTFDEVFWKVKKEKTHKQALKIGKALLKTKNLKFQEVNDEILWKTHELLEKHELDPRDAIHLSCALKNQSEVIISEDKDFDKPEEIKRQWIQ